MDVFSAGCVIAELWLEGKDVFSLSGMLAWKKGESSPEGVISEIEDKGIRVSHLWWLPKRNCAIHG